MLASSFVFLGVLGYVCAFAPTWRRSSGTYIAMSSGAPDHQTPSLLSFGKKATAVFTASATFGLFPVIEIPNIAFAADAAAVKTAAVKPTITTASSQKAIPQKAAAPKLAEEVAVDAAINKKNLDKQKISDLQAAIKSTKTELNSARVDVKSLGGQLDTLNAKLKKDKLDVDVKRAISDEKTRIQKLYNEAKYAQDTAEKKIDQSTKDIDYLTNKRLPEDDKEISAKKEQLKKKREQLVKEAKEEEIRKAQAKAKAQADEYLRIFKQAESDDNKALQEVKSAQSTVQGLTKKSDELKKVLSKEQEAAKKVVDKIRDLEKALAQAKADSVAEEKKLADIGSKITAAKTEVSKAEDALKAKQTAEKAAAAKVEAAKKNVKK